MILKGMSFKQFVEFAGTEVLKSLIRGELEVGMYRVFQLYDQWKEENK